MSIPSTPPRPVVLPREPTRRARWEAIGAVGRVDYLAGGLAAILAFGFVALPRFNWRLVPANRLGLFFSLLVELGRFSDAVGLRPFLGDFHTRQDIFAYASRRVVDAYAFAAAALHLGAAVLVVALGRGLIRGRTWARFGQATLASVGAGAVWFALPAAGALAVTLAVAVIGVLIVAPGLGPVDESPLAPPRAGTGMTGWLVLTLAPVLIPVVFLAAELTLIRLGLVIYSLLV
jgi:hypothetical protein